MHLARIPFGVTDWSGVEETLHPGTTGLARWRMRQFGDIRVRMVEYSAGYLADHWCQKGHIVLCLEGELETELADGRVGRAAAQAGSGALSRSMRRSQRLRAVPPT